MKKKGVIILPMIIITLLSFKAMLSQLLKFDLTDWRLYSAVLGFAIIALLTTFFAVKLRQTLKLK
jgi:hypothetical protein